MKRILVIVFAGVMLSACSKDSGSAGGGIDNPPPPPADENPPPGSVVVQGSFVNGAHSTSGSVKIYNQNGSLSLNLENFKTDNGPDLKVYLSTDRSASVFINLGNLKSVSGAQTYSISGNPDFGSFKYCLIWCQQYAVLFGSAQLQ